MFVFQDVSDLARGRALLERELGLRLIENQFHPPHEHHGLTKYDAGGTIVSLNLFAGRRFRDDSSDGLVMVYRTTDPDRLRDRLTGWGTWRGPLFTDPDGHHYHFTGGVPAGSLTIDLAEVRLAVPRLADAVPFYRDVLGLRVSEHGPAGVRFATGTTDLVLDERPAAPDGKPVRHNACLAVFHTPDVLAAHRTLADSGLVFTQGPGFSDIGGTARFLDPSGHTFCLYEPSAESLGWGSGAKVTELASVAR
jgi:catechol 2,3-dioxygenase-like lactoylglutathione lyase family enzyme